MPNVALDRLFANREECRDFPVRSAERELPQDIDLPTREVVTVPRRKDPG